MSFKPYKRTKILPEGAFEHVLLQSSEHSRLDYIAQEELDGSSESQLKDYVGVFDPATKKLQLVPVKRVTLRSTLRSETEEMREQKEKTEAQQQTMMAKRNALASEFGSRKSRKALDDMTMNAIRSGKPDDPASARNDAVAENILQNMAGATGAMPTKQEMEAAIDSSKPRPTPNLKAEYPGDVYPIETIVGSELMTMIEVKDWVDAAASGQGVNVTSRFVAKRMVKLAQNKQIQKLKVLRFILFCINFHAALQSSKGGKKIPPKGKLEAVMGEDIPQSCVMAIRRKFAREGYVTCLYFETAYADWIRSFEMPRWNVDNLCTHIAAAALIVDDFDVDVNDLRDDLKIDNKQYVPQYHALSIAANVTIESKPTLQNWVARSAHQQLPT